MIKAVIFDFDHTLYDRDLTYEKMVPALCAELDAYVNKELSPAEMLARMQQADRDGAYPSGWPTVYREKIAQGVFTTVPDYDTYMRAVRRHHPVSITLFSDTLQTLTTLREMGMKLGMLTNGGIKSQTDKLNNTPLAPYFDEIIICGTLPEEKPHASAFHTICRALGVAPEEAMFVGDHPYNDVEGAKKAGLTSVWIPYVKPYPADALPPDHTIDALAELVDLVKAHNANN